jgi:hypothetical protein
LFAINIQARTRYGGQAFIDWFLVWEDQRMVRKMFRSGHGNFKFLAATQSAGNGSRVMAIWRDLPEKLQKI